MLIGWFDGGGDKGALFSVVNDATFVDFVDDVGDLERVGHYRDDSDGGRLCSKSI